MKRQKPKSSVRKSAKRRIVAASKRPRKAKPAAVARVKRTRKISGLKIPPILLEGDAPEVPEAPAPSGPGQRYSLGPTPPDRHFPAAGSELPEAYGTRQLFLTARDPRWLYAHWDLTADQLKNYNSLSAEGHLALRIYQGSAEGQPQAEIQVHPESRNWFVPVPEAGAKYLSALGYYDSARRWVTLAHSGATLTPPDALAEETTPRFATIPPDVPFGQLLSIVKDAVREHVPLVEAILQLRARGCKGLPAPEQIRNDWTPAQEKALAEIVSMDKVRRVWVGSLEITELVRRQLQQDVAGRGLPSSPAGGLAGAAPGVSSQFGGLPGRRGFWFNVNAELIIYGSTEPDATVTIGGHQIKLRSDGSFSFRFALPDGEYLLPASAQSADGEETRAARLKFSRRTDYEGDVGAAPQDEKLQPPLPGNVR